MNNINKEQYDIKELTNKVLYRSVPSGCEEIDTLLSNLPPKSWVSRQLPTEEQNKAFELLEEKLKTPTPEIILYAADICCGRYQRIREGNWSCFDEKKAEMLYKQYYEMTNCSETKYILENFNDFTKLCWRKTSNRQYLDNLAPYHNNNSNLSTSRDPDSDECKK